MRLRNGLTYIFGENAPLQAIRDRFGNTIRLVRAIPGLPIDRIVSPNGKWIEFTYGTGGRISQAKDNIGRTVTYTYDASGRLWKVTDAGGGVTEYGYDSSNRMTTIKDPRNITYLTNTYDTNGRVTDQTQADSTTYHFDWTLDGTGAVTQAVVRNPRGILGRWTFNTDHYLTGLVEAVGTNLERSTTIQRANGTNFVTAVTDGLGRTTSATYDTLGNVASITNLSGTPDAVTTTYGWNQAFSELASVTDPLQHTWQLGYDARGNLTSVTDPLGHQTSATYDPTGLVQSVTDPLTHTTTFGYQAGLLTGLTDPLGNTWRAFRDGAGRVRSITDPLGRVTGYDIDALNRLTRTTDVRGGDTSLTWDPNGNLLTLTDAATHTTTWTYDSMDRVATRTDPLQRSESALYDANGNLSQVTDRKQQVTTSNYDALDRPATTAYQDVRVLRTRLTPATGYSASATPQMAPSAALTTYWIG